MRRPNVLKIEFAILVVLTAFPMLYGLYSAVSSWLDQP